MRDRLHKLLTTPPAQLGRAHRFLRFQVKMWLYCARLLRKNRAGQQAAALAYHSIFGLVPLALVMVLVFESMPSFRVHEEKVRTFIYEQLSLTDIQIPVGSSLGSVEPNDPNQVATADDSSPQKTVPLTVYLESMIQRFFAGLNKGSITVVGALFVVWAALGLLTTTERAFNNIWHVPKGRSWVNRVLNYWGLLTLGPLLLGLGVYVTSTYAAASQIQEKVTSHAGPMVVSYGVTWVALFLLYFILPNARVDVRAALWGAAVSALVWTGAKWGFNQYVNHFIPYSKVYGVVGLVPLTVFWIYVTWLIVLFGLQLTFTTQHLSTLDQAQMHAPVRSDPHFMINDLTVIQLLRDIVRTCEQQKCPASDEVICSRLELPPILGRRLLSHLVETGLLVKTIEPTEGYMTARDPGNITMVDIQNAVAQAAYGQDPNKENDLTGLLVTHQEKLSQITLRALLDRDTPTE